MAQILTIPFRSQQEDGYCLPACIQMALAHVGVFHSQADLAKELGVLQNTDVPAAYILKLHFRNIHISNSTEGTLLGIPSWLQRQVPVIICVQTGQLSYWHGLLTYCTECGYGSTACLSV